MWSTRTLVTTNHTYHNVNVHARAVKSAALPRYVKRWKETSVSHPSQVRHYSHNSLPNAGTYFVCLRFPHAQQTDTERYFVCLSSPQAEQTDTERYFVCLGSPQTEQTLKGILSVKDPHKQNRHRKAFCLSRIPTSRTDTERYFVCLGSPQTEPTPKCTHAVAYTAFVDESHWISDCHKDLAQ